MLLDHVNIQAPWVLLERIRDFYVDLFDFEDGPRPAFRRRGFWLYSEGRPLIHLTESPRVRDGEAALDHVAFACEDMDGMIAKLNARGIAHDVNGVQIFLRDPAGVGVELNFSPRGRP